jgi:hypothetical protein
MTHRRLDRAPGTRRAAWRGGAAWSSSTTRLPWRTCTPIRSRPPEVSAVASRALHPDPSMRAPAVGHLTYRTLVRVERARDMVLLDLERAASARLQQRSRLGHAWRPRLFRTPSGAQRLCARRLDARRRVGIGSGGSCSPSSRSDPACGSHTSRLRNRDRAPSSLRAKRLGALRASARWATRSSTRWKRPPSPAAAASSFRCGESAIQPRRRRPRPITRL